MGALVLSGVVADALEGLVAVAFLAAGHRDALVAGGALPADLAGAHVRPDAFAVLGAGLGRDLFAVLVDRGDKVADRGSARVLRLAPSGQANHLVVIAANVVIRFLEQRMQVGIKNF